MSAQAAKRLFTVSEYYRMVDAGILSKEDRVELIEGEIVKLSPIGSQHAGCINCLNALISRLVGLTAVVSIQNPLRISEYSEPEPDLAILKPRSDFYSRKHPTPKEVLLLIEVADTSLAYDQKVKVPLYARAGIPEVWLVDLSSGIITVYTKPVKGQYQHSQQFRRGESLASFSVPGLTLEVNDILG
jgi:Uma2 family endonuclease